MKSQITIPVAELKEALPGLTKVIGKSRTLPVLQTVRINRNQDGIVTLHATDLDSFVTYTAKATQQGSPSDVLVHVDQLTKAAKCSSPKEEIGGRSGGQRGGSVGRPHVATALMEQGHVASVQEAFDRFLADGKPAYVPRQRVPAAEAIGLIRGADGLPVLAHPGIYGNDGMIPELARDGLVGIEVFHRDHNPTDVIRYRRRAVRHDCPAREDRTSTD